jgi:hypothetical protein
MNFSSIFARIVAMIGACAVLLRRMEGVPQKAAWGNAPEIPEAKPQGAISTLSLSQTQSD